MNNKFSGKIRQGIKRSVAVALSVATVCSFTPYSLGNTQKIQVKASETQDTLHTYDRYSEPFTLDTDKDGELENVWSTFTYGEYPQSQVTDEETLNMLEDISEAKWVELDNPITDYIGSEKNLYYTATIKGTKYLRMKMSDSYFGSLGEETGYYQWDSDEEYHYYVYEPITWRILSINEDGTDAMVISDVNLDTQPYTMETSAKYFNHKNVQPYEWKYSTIRSFLNGYDKTVNAYGMDFSNAYSFINMAFSQEEQQNILSTTVKNEKEESYYGYYGSSNTTDKIYCLSYKELADKAYGFTNYESRRAVTTDYTHQKNAYTAYGFNYWWLRSAGDGTSRVMNIDCFGHIQDGGNGADYTDITVRPVMHVNLTALSEKNYAGYVDENRNTYIAKATFALNNETETISLVKSNGYIYLPADYEQDGYDYYYYYNGKRLRSFPVISNKDVTINVVRKVHANTITIYYKATSSWKDAYIHYKVASGNWTTAPGKKMESSSEEDGYNYKYVIDCGDESSATVCFNNGSGSWDSQNGSNYKLNALGEYGITHHNSKITTISLRPTATPAVTATPEVTATPAATATPVITETPEVTATPEVTETPEITALPTSTPEVTIAPTQVPESALVLYYSTGWKEAYAHYKVDGEDWTTLPGIKMEKTDEREGYTHKLVVPFDTKKKVTVCFNNGKGNWDSKNGANYAVESGVYGVKNGVVSRLETEVTPLPTVTPTPTQNPIEKSITVYYSTGWTNAYIHYKNGKKDWTAAPGVKMEATNEVAGYNYKYVIPVDESENAIVCFNNGNGSWDSKAGANYTLGSVGTYGVKNGVITQIK